MEYRAIVKFPVSKTNILLKLLYKAIINIISDVCVTFQKSFSQSELKQILKDTQNHAKNIRFEIGFFRRNLLRFS